MVINFAGNEEAAQECRALCLAESGGKVRVEIVQADVSLAADRARDDAEEPPALGARHRASRPAFAPEATCGELIGESVPLAFSSWKACTA